MCSEKGFLINWWDVAKGIVKVVNPCDLETKELEQNLKKWVLKVAQDDLFPNLPQAVVTIDAGAFLGFTLLDAVTGGGTYEGEVAAELSVPISPSIKATATVKTLWAAEEWNVTAQGVVGGVEVGGTF